MKSLHELLADLGVAVDATLDGRPESAREILRSLVAAGVRLTVEDIAESSLRDTDLPRWMLIRDEKGAVLRISDLEERIYVVDRPFPDDVARCVEYFDNAGTLRHRAWDYPGGRRVVEFGAEGPR